MQVVFLFRIGCRVSRIQPQNGPNGGNPKKLGIWGVLLSKWEFLKRGWPGAPNSAATGCLSNSVFLGVSSVLARCSSVLARCSSVLARCSEESPLCHCVGNFPGSLPNPGKIQNRNRISRSQEIPENSPGFANFLENVAWTDFWTATTFSSFLKIVPVQIRCVKSCGAWYVSAN